MLNTVLENTKKKIFTLHTSKMSLNEDVDLEEFINQKDDLSGADIRAICSEAGLMALRERRMRVNMADFRYVILAPLQAATMPTQYSIIATIIRIAGAGFRLSLSRHRPNSRGRSIWQGTDRH